MIHRYFILLILISLSSCKKETYVIPADVIAGSQSYKQFLGPIVTVSYPSDEQHRSFTLLYEIVYPSPPPNTDEEWGGVVMKYYNHARYIYETVFRWKWGLFTGIDFRVKWVDSTGNTIQQVRYYYPSTNSVYYYN